MPLLQFLLSIIGAFLVQDGMRDEENTLVAACGFVLLFVSFIMAIMIFTGDL